MIAEKRVLALIPARGGSKGLPGKNIKPLAGRPLICWSVGTALESRFVDRTIVSTDSVEIAEVARSCGADVPFFRPAELARDESPTIDAILYTVDRLSEEFNEHYDIIVLLQPTSPLRTTEDLDGALQRLVSTDGGAIVSVTPCDHHPLWANTLPTDLSMEHFLRPEVLQKRRQDLPAYYQLNGAVYAGTTEYVRAMKSFLGAGTYAWIMPPERSVDIDTPLDLAFAEFLCSSGK